MKFYPSRMKYIDPNVEAYSRRNLCNVKTSVHSSEWRSSLFCAWFTFAHLYIILVPLFQLLMPCRDLISACSAVPQLYAFFPSSAFNPRRLQGSLL